MKIVNLQDINTELVTDPAGFASRADEEYEGQIRALAEDLAKHREERPILLLSGPSGSGKTTTALKIEKYLDEKNCETHTLSMDDYFFPLTPEEVELSRRGEFDLETPKRVDAELLAEQLRAMFFGETVRLPRYDFQTSRRVYTGETITRKKGEIVILEGIHALNHDVVRIPDEWSARAYISVRTRVRGRDGEILHPSYIRLLRRMIRDSRTRGRSLSETLKKYPSVERGEALYIMPHKHRATHEIDTFFPYELSVYRPILMRELTEMTQEEQKSLETLMNVLQDAVPLHARDLSENAMIREFIGQGEDHD